MEQRLSQNFWIGILICFVLGIAAPRTLAFLPSVLGALFFATAYFSQKQFFLPEKKIVILFVSIITLGFISSFWSVNQDFSIERSLKITTVFLPGLLFLALCNKAHKPSNIFLYAAIILQFVAAVFLMSEKISGHQIIEFVLGKEVFDFKLNRSFVVLSLFSIPVLFLIKNLTLQKTKKTALFLFVLFTTLLSLKFTESQTAQLSFLAGFLFLVLFPARFKVAIKSLAVLIIIFCLTFPLLVKPVQERLPAETLTQGIGLKASIMNRFDVWNFAAEAGFKSPLYGNGIEAMRFMKSDTHMKYQEADGALHAHNAVLQIWVEFGITGLLLGCAFILFLFAKILRQNNANIRRLYLSVFIGCFLCSLTGFGLWQGWQLGLFLAVAGFTIISAKTAIKNS